MSTRTLGLSDELAAYVAAHNPPEDEVLASITAETRSRWPDWINLQIAPEQGAFMALLVELVGARVAVEVGTFTGYSSVWIARALPAGGCLHCFDSSEEWTTVARDAWQRAGLTDRVTLHLGDATETLEPVLAGEEPVGFGFIDADKPAYPAYYETLLAHLAPDGLIAVDNTLSNGRVLDPQDDNAKAIAEFNRQVADDDRVTAVLVPVADGVTLIRPRRPAP
jgi:caffeoyl-CoA O-methyltransferase